MAAWVYLLRCRDGSLYCGWTVDVVKRVAQHNAGRGAAYTRARKPVALVWHEPCADRSAALRRELAIKRLTRRQKLALVAAATTTAAAAESSEPVKKPPGHHGEPSPRLSCMFREAEGPLGPGG